MSTAAWATTTTVDGSGFLTDYSNPYTIEPNKKFTISFTSTTKSTGIWNAWVTILKPTDTTFDNDDTSTFYTLLRSDVFGWGNSYDETKISGSDPAEITNAASATDVVLTVERAGSMVQTFVKATNGTKTYVQYFHNTIGDGTQNIELLLSIDNAKLVIDEDSKTVVDNTTEADHLIVGNSDNTTPFWTAFSDYYTIAPNGSLNLQFKNFTDGAANPNNWVAAISNDANRFAAGYEEYVVLRSDNYGWQGSKNTSDTSWFTELSSWYDWTNFTTDMEGALVNMYVSRSGAKVTLRADVTTTNGATHFEQFIIDCGDGTQNIRVFLTADHGHLDIDNNKTNTGHFNTALISPLGWSTYCSSHPLDFSSVSGLEAYMITGHVGNAVTLSKVTGTIPAQTGLLLKGTPSTYYDIPIVSSSSTSTTGNLLVSCYQWDINVSKEDAKTKYVLSANSSSEAEFKKVDTNSANVDRGKAYLLFDEVISARELTFAFDSETTGINMVNGEGLKVNGSDVYYNLQGQRVLYPTKGLYIVNGKKVIVK